MPGDEARPAGRSAQEAWALATLPRALAFASSLLRDRGEAEDVVHDCYVRLLGKAGTYDLPRDGTRILYKAITNACIDRNYRDRTVLSLEIELIRGGGGVPSPVADDPHDLAALRELEAAVSTGLARLSVAQRGALELKSLGYSLAEIGEALGVSPNNAGVLVHRARQALAGQLAPFLGGRPDD